eukprot:2330216-Rhodomonas_salina.2
MERIRSSPCRSYGLRQYRTSHSACVARYGVWKERRCKMHMHLFNTDGLPISEAEPPLPSDVVEGAAPRARDPQGT